MIYIYIFVFAPRGKIKTRKCQSKEIDLALISLTSKLYHSSTNFGLVDSNKKRDYHMSVYLIVYLLPLTQIVLQMDWTDRY